MGKVFIILIILCTSNFSKDNLEKYFIKEFKLEKMLGSWYEIVRKENFYENNLDYAVTTYTKLNNGEIEIVTKGYNRKKRENTITKGVGKVKYSNAENIIEAKFFGLVYFDYIVLDYDRKHGSYIMFRGENPNYFWILAREPVLNEKIVEKLIKIGEDSGITRENLVYVKQK